MGLKCAICGERYPRELIKVINGIVVCQMCLEKNKNNIPLKFFRKSPVF